MVYLTVFALLLAQKIKYYYTNPAQLENMSRKCSLIFVGGHKGARGVSNKIVDLVLLN